jgi:hypothetical protein
MMEIFSGKKAGSLYIKCFGMEKMLKKIMFITVLTFAVLSLAGCGENESAAQTENSSIVEKISESAAGAVTETAEVSESVAKTMTETSACAADTNAESLTGSGTTVDLIRDFANGNGAVHTKASLMNDVSYNFELEKDKDYTLKDLIALYNLSLSDGEKYGLDTVSYAALTVPNVSGEWYAVQMVLVPEEVSDTGNGNDSIDMVFDVMNGQLQMAACADSYYRSSCTCNKNGVLFTGGADGAGDHSGAVYAPDANGDYVTLQSYETINYGWEFYNDQSGINESLSEFATAIGEDAAGDGHFDTSRYEINGSVYYVFGSDHPEEETQFSKIALSHGITMTTLDELNSIMDTYAGQLGIGAAYQDNEETPWTKL